MAIPVVDTTTTPSMSLGDKAGLLDCGGAGLTEQRVRRIQIEPVAFLPAVGMFVPVYRRDDVALGNAGVVEHARQPVEQFLAPAEKFASLGFRDALFNDVGRHGSG